MGSELRDTRRSGGRPGRHQDPIASSRTTLSRRMNDADRHRLLHGPYDAPALRRGDRAMCLFRDGEVIVTGWSDGRISWPRCQRVGSRGGSGLLVDEELARAVRLESSLAIQHWWGVSGTAVWHWRRAFGLGQWDTEGSLRLHRASSEAGAAKTSGKKLLAQQVERRRRTAVEMGLRPTGRWKGRGWTRDQLRLLGKLSDAEVAARIGRTPNAVRIIRTRLGILTASDRRRRG